MGLFSNIKLKDVASFAEGMILRDKELTQENMAIRNANLEANRKLLIDQKNKKYETEINAYNEEKKKYDTLKSAAYDFNAGNIGPKEYAGLYYTTKYGMDNFNSLPNDVKENLINNFDGKTVDFSLKGNIDEIQANQAAEIRAINDETANAIKESKGDSFLINKILRKKSINEKKLLEDVENKIKAAETIELTETKLPPELVGIPVKSSEDTTLDLAWRKFNASDEGKAWMKKYLDEQKASMFNAITYRDNFNNILKFLDVKEMTTEGNFVTDGYDVKIEGVNETTRALFDTYKDIYASVWKSIDAKELWMQGVEIQDIIKEVNTSKITNTIYKVAESRWFQLSFKDENNKKADFLGVLPINIVPLDMNNLNYGKINNVPIVSEETGQKLDTLNLTGPNKVFTVLYENFIKQKAKETGVSFNALQTAMAKGASQDLINEYKIYVGQNFEKIAKELGLDNEISSAKKISLQDNNGEIVLWDSSTNKAVSLTQLQSEGKLDAVIEKYPWIKEDPKYIEWLEKQPK